MIAILIILAVAVAAAVAAVLDSIRQLRRPPGACMNCGQVDGRSKLGLHCHDCFEELGR